MTVLKLKTKIGHEVIVIKSRHLSSALNHQVSSTEPPPVVIDIDSALLFFVHPRQADKDEQRQTDKCVNNITIYSIQNNIVRINLFAVLCLLLGGCCLEPLIAGAAWDCGSCCSFPSVGMPASLN